MQRRGEGRGPLSLSLPGHPLLPVWEQFSLSSLMVGVYLEEGHSAVVEQQLLSISKTFPLQKVYAALFVKDVEHNQ